MDGITIKLIRMNLSGVKGIKIQLGLFMKHLDGNMTELTRMNMNGGQVM